MVCWMLHNRKKVMRGNITRFNTFQIYDLMFVVINLLTFRKNSNLDILNNLKFTKKSKLYLIINNNLKLIKN